jgi:hypothetical protein
VRRSFTTCSRAPWRCRDLIRTRRLEYEFRKATVARHWGWDPQRLSADSEEGRAVLYEDCFKLWEASIDRDWRRDRLRRHETECRECTDTTGQCSRQPAVALAVIPSSTSLLKKVLSTP